MKLTLEGIKDCELWNKAGITLPGYDVEKVSQKAKEEPKWVHFGIGNIFRIFIGGIADGLLEEGVLDRAITCVETFDSVIWFAWNTGCPLLHRSRIGTTIRPEKVPLPMWIMPMCFTKFPQRRLACPWYFFMATVSPVWVG